MIIISERLELYIRLTNKSEKGANLINTMGNQFLNNESITLPGYQNKKFIIAEWYPTYGREDFYVDALLISTIEKEN